jgi:hypothetical protein
MRRFLCTCVCALLLCVVPVSVSAQDVVDQTTTEGSPPPTLIPLSGQLKDAAGLPRSGTVSLKLSLYPTADDPNPLWIEEQLATLDATGNYGVYFGATQPTGLPSHLFANNGARWVGVAVAGEPELPRTMIISVAYASKANAADSVGGKRATDFVLSENLKPILKSWGVPMSTEGTADTLLPSGGGETMSASSSSSSTPNALVKYLDSLGTMGESAVMETGGNVGIGTTSPQMRLEAAGNSWPAASVHINAATTDVSSGLLRFSKSRGTLAAPADVQFGDQLGSLAFHGRSGATNFGTAEINALVDGTFATGQRPPSRLAFVTSPANGASATRMVIGSNGYVGIGTTAPLLKLEAAGDTWADASLHLNAATPDLSSPVFRLSKSRGTQAVPTDVQTGDQLGSIAFHGRSGGLNFGTAEINALVDGAFASGQRPPSRLEFWTQSVAGASAARMVVRSDGRVGIGTATPSETLDVAGNVKATGNITADGTIAAKYQDVAEWVDAVEPLAAATVVTADLKQANRVRKSAKAYDTAVLGVVSARPGLLLGEKGEGKIAVAQSGRVKVKVDARYGAIKPGDLLVTSPVAGYAMRSRPLRSGIHRPGTIIGKALEALPKGRGEILVLLTLQ